MQRSAAIASALSTISRAPSSVFCSSASAALCAKGPPEPMATTPSSGSSTSPAPVMMSECSRSATASIASSRRRMRSVRQSLASSTAERIRLPWCFSSFASKRSKSVKASAVPPAKPARMRSWYRRRIFFAPPFTTTLPSVTWPSPPSATLAPRRTERIVVPWNCSIGRESRGKPLDAALPARSQEEERRCNRRHRADDHGAGREICHRRGEQARGVPEHADGIRLPMPMSAGVVRRQRRHHQRAEHEEQADELHRYRHRAREHYIETHAPDL